MRDDLMRIDLTRLSAHWRPAYLGSVAVAAALAWLAWPDTPRLMAERVAFAGGWAVVSLVYGLTAWRSRGADETWRRFDNVAWFVLAQVGVYEAMWPGTGAIVTPGVLGMTVAGAAFAISLRATRRQSPAPAPALDTAPELVPATWELPEADAASVPEP